MFGEYTPAHLPQLLGGVDAVVMPSLVPEAFPLSPREALALGVPVVASALGGLPEIVTDGVNGLLVDGASPHALRESLQRLARMPAPARNVARRRPLDARHDRSPTTRTRS